MQRLRQFTYFEPITLQEAIEILTEKGHGTCLLAGGTDLLVRMKKGEIAPASIVNLKRIKGLDQIRQEAEKDTRIGALASLAAIESSPIIQASHPVLAQAAGLVGSISIRNLGTIGGNIGRASPASDIAPSLMVLKSRVTVHGPLREREIDVADIFTGPGTTTLSAEEVITSFVLPAMSSHSGAAYIKTGRTSGMDCALVGVAALLTLGDTNSEAKEARIAIASVGPVPFRAMKAEDMLMSGALTEKRIREAARVASNESTPIDDFRASASYRKEMVRVLTFRALSRSLHTAERRLNRK